MLGCLLCFPSGARRTPGKQCGLTATGVYAPSFHSPWRAADVGHLPANLPEDLQFKLDVMNHAYDKDAYPDIAPPSKYQETLRDVAEKTIQHKRQLGKREKTLGKYNRSVDVFLDHLQIKDIPIASIRRKQVVGFSMDMQAVKAGSTVSNYLTFLSEIWQMARDLELLEGENPFRGHRVKNDKQRYRPWSEAELKDLHELLPESDRLMLRIGVYTGARLDEIHTLTPEDIREVETDQGNVLCFHLKPKGDGKNTNATRIVPVHPALLDDLKEFKGYQGTSDAYSKRFGKVKAKYLGDENSRQYCFHSIRHTLSTALHRAGIDELIISYVTGHSNPGRSEAGRTYIHGPTLRQMEKALEKLPVIV